ncbi:MAG: isochorismatase family protein [Bacteroidetes bacterium]|nr:isochorismatase family protein [Bacteroidota bacterium]
MTVASEYINEVAGYFRKKNLPIVWIQDIEKESGVVPDTEGFEVIDLLDKKSDEISIYKEYGNSFNKTECGNILIKEGVDVIIMAGFSAESCVLATYRGAMDLDFMPVLLRHGVISGDKENLRFVEKICDTVSYKMIGKMLENM